jgi:hypothetical protein
MPAMFSVVLTFALSLWFGGLIWLFVTVSKLFALDRPMAVLIAPTFFNSFNRYQLSLGICACLTAAALWWLHRRKLNLVPVACVATALIVVIAIFAVTYRLDALRLAGQSQGVDFRKLHGLSMVLYLTTSVLVAIALGAHTFAANLPRKFESR